MALRFFTSRGNFPPLPQAYLPIVLTSPKGFEPLLLLQTIRLANEPLQPNLGKVRS